jgi:hypothetical protein
MKTKLEKLLHFAAAAVTLGTVAGLHPVTAALLQASISVGLALFVRVAR